jgi:iron complex transport system ATP-binding protein
MPRLVASRIVCGYGKRIVLRDFDLAAEPATLTALLGPNGAGKSTALRALARLLRLAGGSVTLDGEDIWRLPRRSFVRQVAFVSQTAEAHWPMTVEQLVLLGRAPHRGWLLPYSSEDREALVAALRQVDLEAFRGRSLDSLSGGERRRAVVARALAQEARVLLLDEPGAHLDVRHHLELFDLLRHLARERQVAIVLSLHDLNLASLFADRAVLLNEGQILAQGSCTEVLTPELIWKAFGVEVETVPHPTHGTAMVLPVLSGIGKAQSWRSPVADRSEATCQ